MNTKVAKQIKTNINVGMGEVVDVFISDFEQQLLSKRAELVNIIAKAKKNGESVIEEIKTATRTGAVVVSSNNNDALINVETGEQQLICTLLKEGFQIDVDEHLASWNAIIEFDGKAAWRSQIDINIPVNIDNQLWKKLDGYSRQFEQAEAELISVTQELANISRKERQVRGVIARQKLEMAGMDELLNNPEIQNALAIPQLSTETIVTAIDANI